MAVVGGREAAAGTAAIRVRGSGRKQEVLPRPEIISLIRAQVATRSLQVGFGHEEE
jgi:hypothetical protein